MHPPGLPGSLRLGRITGRVEHFPDSAADAGLRLLVAPRPRPARAWPVTDIVGIDHVQLAAPRGCEQAARGFFGDVLGLEELEKPPLLDARGGCWFRVGAQELHVGVADPFGSAQKAHPAFRVASVTDLRALADRLRDIGAAVEWADEREVPGVLRFFAHDPWGNRLEFVAREV